jgi:hypothetical protein
MVTFHSALLDIVLADGTVLSARRYEDDAGGFALPVGTDATWPSKVVGIDGMQVRRTGKPRERAAVTARWATDDDAVPDIPMTMGADRILLLEPKP